MSNTCRAASTFISKGIYTQKLATNIPLLAASTFISKGIYTIFVDNLHIFCAASTFISKGIYTYSEVRYVRQRLHLPLFLRVSTPYSS